MLDYKLVQALAMVIQERGFERAARALNITQSAVSQRVKLLEEQLGQILLIRITPPRPTPAGRQLLKHYLQVNRLEADLAEAMAPEAGRRFTTMAVGINADSLATWFLEAVRPLLLAERLVVDIRTDDQERTHRMLKDGEVVGCISTQATPLQGCRSLPLGRMTYGLFAAPAFAGRWFPGGVTPQAIGRAPAVIFNRKDALHRHLFRQAFGAAPDPIPCHYIPSSEKFADCILMGLGYGMLPRQQSAAHLAAGRLVALMPDHQVRVDLYWQCWNLRSVLLEKLTRQLCDGAKRLLAG
ncbi:MAG: LysR family transcriptional regulator ArgP [Desulfosarcinaceae bacterium]|nr:LysR family transcriptional regulator ArgP [Desulfosarcinaceae bacterium]